MNEVDIGPQAHTPISTAPCACNGSGELVIGVAYCNIRSINTS